MAGGASRYREAYNAGNTGKALPAGLASLADTDPLIDQAHDAGRNGVPFDQWRSGSVPAPTPATTTAGGSRGSRGARGARGGRSARSAPRRSSGSGGRRPAPSIPRPTFGQPLGGLTTGQGIAGVFFGLVVYAVGLSVVEYGVAGPGLWFKAKFLNQAAGSSPSSTSSPATGVSPSTGSTAPKSTGSTLPDGTSVPSGEPQGGGVGGKR